MFRGLCVEHNGEGCRIAEPIEILLRRRVQTRGVHGDGDGGNPAETAGFPRVWV